MFVENLTNKIVQNVGGKFRTMLTRDQRQNFKPFHHNNFVETFIGKKYIIFETRFPQMILNLN